jgi:hypothetical protein
MAKLKDFIIALAKKAGFDTENAAVKPFFDALGDADVPEDIHKGIDNSLISLTEAKNNHPELKNHYQAQSLAGVDTALEELMASFELGDDERKPILSERSTYKRVPLLTRAIVELDRKKNATHGSKDKQEIQKQIDELHQQLKAEKEARAQEKTQFDNQRLQDRINSKKNILFSGLKTIHDELDSETRYSILDTLVDKALRDSGAKFVFDEQGNFNLVRNDGTNYFGENHQQIKPQAFIEQVLAKSKQIKVSQTNGQQNGNNNNGQAHQPPAAGNGANGGNNGQSYSTLVDRNKQALDDYNKSVSTGAFGV